MAPLAWVVLVVDLFYTHVLNNLKFNGFMKKLNSIGIIYIGLKIKYYIIE